MQNIQQALSNCDRKVSLADEVKLIASGNMFDVRFYRAAVGAIADADPIEHYLLYGWREGFEPSAGFEVRWLHPYFESAGFDGPPALTYTTLQRAGAPVYPNRDAAERVAKLVRDSGLFDGESYAAGVGNIAGLDPALHYVIIGERLGYAPSARFDPIYYMMRYSDLAQAPVCLLAHYFEYGKQAGHRAISIASDLIFDRSRIDPARETILIVSHQASRTGAPILAYNIARRFAQKYNVVTLVLLPGELTPDFNTCSVAVVGPATIDGEWVYPDGVDPIEAKYIVERLLANYSLSFAIVNSIDSRAMLPPLTLSFVPTVTLVHEFPTDLTQLGRPMGEMGRALEWTTQIVFSSPFAAESARVDYPPLDERPVHLLPQGPSELPPRGNSTTRQQQADAVRRMMRPSGTESHVVVLGCGTIFARKGVDLFFECAARVAELQTRQPVRFIWIGKQLSKSMLSEYFIQLTNQIRHAGIADRAIILDEVTDLEPAYASADILFVSSRIDALPNTAIDCALRGLPIVCFDETGGVPELLKSDDATKFGVIVQFDVDAAAAVIAKLADNNVLRQQLGSITRQIGQRTFDMDRYVANLESLGHEAARIMRQRAEDFETIRSDPLFDVSHFLECEAPILSRDDAIRLFLARVGAIGSTKRPTTNWYYRRPCPGFHPQIYIHENADRYEARVVNPLAHFIRTGKPVGPWWHDVITPDNPHDRSAPTKPLNIAVHGHFFYPELISNFVAKLAVNEAKCDLLLSTDSERKAKQLQIATTGYDRGEVLIRIVPNRGRDIGAFLTGFGHEIVNYDVVGHLHSKRSLHVGDRHVGEQWREFLWQNLLGGLYPMMDTVLDCLATDDSIGLVFADDPHLSDWDLNRQIAEDLARRMGTTEPLPPFFDFPLGTMFWVRPCALEPLLRLNFQWDGYPVEPVPIDGTMLHAIERLLPFAARQAGYRYATTYVPGMTW